MESRFEGGLIGMIGVGLWMVILSVFTIGLGVPWAVCFRERWYVKHTVIDGKRLCFDGKGIQLFGNYIKWVILTIITFGIYSFWLSIKMKQWVTKHTHMEG